MWRRVGLALLFVVVGAVLCFAAPVNVNAVGTPIVIHFHTLFSDGAKSPEEVRNGLVNDGLKGVIVTDHHRCYKRGERFSEIGTTTKEINWVKRDPGDLYVGYPNYLAKATSLSSTGFVYIPGAELSCSSNGKDQHLLLLDISNRDLRSLFVENEDSGTSGLARGRAVGDDELRRILEKAHELRVPTVAAHPANPINPYYFGDPSRRTVRQEFSPRLVEFFNNGTLDRKQDQPTSQFDRRSAEAAELRYYLQLLAADIPVGVTAGSDFHTDDMNYFLSQWGDSNQWHRYTFICGKGSRPSRDDILAALYNGQTYAAAEAAGFEELSPEPGLDVKQVPLVKLHAKIRGYRPFREHDNRKRTKVYLYRADQERPLQTWDWPIRDDSITVDYTDTSVTPGNTYTYVVYAPYQVVSSPIRLKVPDRNASSPPTSTIFVLDRSGSMSMNTPDNVQKLEAAKRAAKHCLDVIRFDAERLGANHQVGVLAFSDAAEVLLAPTATLDEAEAAIERLTPGGSTNFGDSLDQSLGQLERLPADRLAGRKDIIFLSDGRTNTGPVARDEFLVGAPDDFANPLRLYQRARDGKVEVYTIGFGDPGHNNDDSGCDEEVLRKLAEVPGTGGRYLSAADAFQLDEVYVRSFHNATGQVVFEHQGTVAQGERQAVGGFDVGPTKQVASARRSRSVLASLSLFVTPAYADESSVRSQMLITLGWNVGKLGLELKDPAGRTVDAQYPGTHLRMDEQPICVAIDSPKVGKWTATVIGEDVPQGESRYHLIASARVPPRPVSGGGGGGGAVGSSSEEQLLTAVLLAICVVLALSIAVLMRRRRDAVRAATHAVRTDPRRQTRRGGTLR